MLRIKSAELSRKIAHAEALPNVSVFGGARTNYSNRGIRIGEPTVSLLSIPASFGGEQGILTIPQQIPNIQESPYFEQFNDNISYFVGLNLNIPIYSNYAIKGGQQRAKINMQRSQLGYDQSVENLKITVGQALTDARVAKSQYQAAQQSLEAQRNLYNNTLKRFEAGTSNTFELARIKALMDSAVYNEVISRYDYVFRVKILDFYLGIPIEAGL
jgi:outer membrane protein